MENIKRYLHGALMWVVFSSENSAKVSSTIKNGLPALILVLGIFNVDTSHLPQVIDLLVDTMLKVSAMVLSARTAWFAFRKLKLTVLGQNAVLNDATLR